MHSRSNWHLEVLVFVEGGRLKERKKTLGAGMTGLEIMAGQRTMSVLIGDLTGQTLALPVKLTSHIRS